MNSDGFGISTILIVDDNKDNLGVISEYLKNEGYKILVANSGKTALGSVNRKKPDLILLDVKMPGIDGFKLCRKLKQNPAITSIPVIFVTASANKENIKTGFEAGGVDYITKPINKFELISRVKSHLEISFLRNKLETEVERKTKEIKNAKNYISNIINSMPSILIGVDSFGKITQWNSKAENITGIKAKEANGKNIIDVFPQMTSETDKIKESIKCRETKIDLNKARNTENGMIYENITIYPLIANGDEGAVIRLDDVTEHYKMEEMMIQSEKMLSIGGLAAGMAHEINNPIGGMIQTAAILKERLTGNIPASIKTAKETGTNMETIRAFMEKRSIPRMLDSIHASGVQVSEIVKNMLSFARKENKGKTRCDIKTLMDNSIFLASSNYDFRKIKITKEYNETSLEISCEPIKIKQVFLNILTNGAQAMLLQNEQSHEDYNPAFIISIKPNNDKTMIIIKIQNNGPFINETTRKQIFEPFFTTKKEGEGTGLGLSVSYFIISENHNGEITVESSPEQGVTFIIKLPVNPKFLCD